MILSKKVMIYYIVLLGSSVELNTAHMFDEQPVYFGVRAIMLGVWWQPFCVCLPMEFWEFTREPTLTCSPLFTFISIWIQQGVQPKASLLSFFSGAILHYTSTFFFLLSLWCCGHRFCHLLEKNCWMQFTSPPPTPHHHHQPAPFKKWGGGDGVCNQPLAVQ